VTYRGSSYLGGCRMNDNFKPSSNFLKQFGKTICQIQAHFFSMRSITSLWG
jgi:hypothetical protein